MFFAPMTVKLVRQKLGCLLFDVPRLLPALLFRDQWIRACNRGEGVKVEMGGVNTDVLGPYSSDLYVNHVFPRIGMMLMKHALDQWPIKLTWGVETTKNPDISFVIPHRGVERLPLLRMTIGSIFSQRDVSVECIVVEQSTIREVHGLPEGVRYIHLPHPEDAETWRKSWAFNVGVAEARADIVVCHDGDIMVPLNYAQEIIRRLRGENYQTAHLQRFLFSLDEISTENVIHTGGMNLTRPLDFIRQNWKGGTVAITKDAFKLVGGYDERFTGWTAEDREFYDRCLTLKGWRKGYLPFVHLWHPPQPTKFSEQRETNLKFSEEIMRIPREKRIERLRATQALPGSSGG